MKKKHWPDWIASFVSFWRNHAVLADIVLALLFAFITCLVASTSLSPLYPETNYDGQNGDSNFYRYCAYLWLHGKTPYLDFYDHKGIYHLLLNVLGLLIGGRYGIWLLEIVWSFFNLLILARCVRLLKGNDIQWRILLYGLYLLLFSLVSQGNNEAEWVLPFVNLALFGYLNGIKKKDSHYFLLGSFFMGLEVGLAFNSRPIDALWGGVSALYFVIYSTKNKRFWDLLWNALTAIVGCAIPFAIFYPMAIQGGYLNQMVYAIFLQSGHYLLRNITGTVFIYIFNRALVVVAVAYYCFSYHFMKKNMPAEKELNFYFLFLGLASSLIYFFALGYFTYFLSGFGFICLDLIYSISAFPPLKKIDLRKLLTYAVLTASVVYNAILVTGYYTFGVYDFSYQESKRIKEDVLAIPEEDRKTAGKVFAIDLGTAIYLDGDIVVNERFLCFTSWFSNDNDNVTPEVISYISGEISGVAKPKWLLIPAQNPNVKFNDAIDKYYVFYSRPNDTFAIYEAKNCQSTSCG